MGVTLFRDTAPHSFGLFDRALSSMFRLTGGETWIDELVVINPDDGMRLGVGVGGEEWVSGSRESGRRAGSEA
jgi:hypothetical protein